ncbi:MAG: hypothetical protein PHY43_10145 [Verrucomicrobiales bacterium]|nr:hypothetical protein [Verrucomicrobiales bacterium]
MKTTKTVCKTILFIGVVIASLAGLPASAQETNAPVKPVKPMKGGEHLMMLNHITTIKEANAVKPDDTFAMVCGKCKTVYVTRVKQGTKGAQLLMGPAPTELIGTHACAGCGGTWTITGVGKGATTELKHSCSACGDDSGFCCATTPNAKPTKGMGTDK